MIRIDKLRFAWPQDRADCLDIEHLSVPAGRTLFLHGPSGCGKSTLLGLLAGVLVPRARPGRAARARPGRRCPAARRDARRADHVGYIFQQFNLLPYLSVLDNVLLPCRFSALRRAARALAGGAAPRPRSQLLQRVGLAAGAVAAPRRRAVGGPAAARGGGARADRPARSW